MSSVSELQSMFPNIEPGVVRMIMESVSNNMTQASELLIEMSQDDQSEHRMANTKEPPKPYSHVMDQEFPEIPSPSRSSLSSVVRSPSRPLPSRQTNAMKSSSLSNIGSKMSVGDEDKVWMEWIEGVQAKNEKLMIVMRGLPGSGKSTLAKKIVKVAGCGVVLSTDDYFSRGGQYRFVPEQLSEAHAYNHDRAGNAVKEKVPLVIIDNTNTMSWEFRPYIEMAVAHGYRIQLLEPSTDWRFKPGQLAAKNSHGVPKLKIEQMLDRYEKVDSIESLLEKWNLKSLSNALAVAVEEEGGEVYISDDDEEDETEVENQVASETEKHSTLNPHVNEFVPDFTAASDNPESVEIIEDGDDIANLVNIFPHLTVEEATEMYDTPSINMKLDQGFAEILQTYFGSPAPPDYLTKLPQDQMLSLDISLGMAKIIFTIWQQNVLTKLNDDSILETTTSSNAQSSSTSSLAKAVTPKVPAVSTAKTVLAPNAAAYYEDKMMQLATKASLLTAEKKRPMIVVQGQVEEEYEEFSALDLETLIEERDSLYRKAMDTKGTKMQGAASYYAAKARELNTVIKQAQKEQQMEMFLTINKGIPKTKLDLHYLQTGEAIKQLQHFIGQWEAYVKKSRNSQSLEIVTGRGNRSEHGKSRLRPAVTTWLAQKNFQYSEVNDGCLKVTIRPRK